MENNKLSRRQKAKLRAEQAVEVKSLFTATSNNSNFGIDLMEAFVGLYANESKLLEISQKNATISTCIDIIASIVAVTPMNLYRIQKDGTFLPVRGKRFVDHALSKPNDEDTEFTFKYKLIQNLLVTGNVYLVRVSNQSFVIPSNKIKKMEDGTYEVNLGAKTIQLKKQNVLQIFKPDLNYYNNLSGLLRYKSTVFNVLKEVLLNEEIMKQSTKHIKSGMMARGVLTQDKDATSSLSQNQMGQLARQFTEATSGDKSQNTVMLPKGIDYQPIQQTAADAGVLELQEGSKKDIVKAFKIPESIFNSEAGSSYATANIQEVQFYKNTIKPLCILIEQFVNQSDLFTSTTEYFKFELGNMMSAEEENVKAETRNLNANTASTLSSLNKFSPNEVREAAGFDELVDENEMPVPEADINPIQTELDEDNEEQVADNANAAPVAEQPATVEEPVAPAQPAEQLPEILNGAQITSIVDLIQLVATGQIPRDSAINIIMVGFNLTKEQAESMIGSAGSEFKPVVP